MKNGDTEPNEKYLEMFKPNIITLQLIKGAHIFFSPSLPSKECVDSTIMAIAAEEDRNKAILLLKNANEARFGSLLSKLK